MGNVKKFTIVKLKGAKLNVVKIPRMKGKKYITNILLFNIKIIYKLKLLDSKFFFPICSFCHNPYF